MKGVLNKERSKSLLHFFIQMKCYKSKYNLYLVATQLLSYKYITDMNLTLNNVIIHNNFPHIYITNHGARHTITQLNNKLKVLHIYIM